MFSLDHDGNIATSQLSCNVSQRTLQKSLAWGKDFSLDMRGMLVVHGGEHRTLRRKVSCQELEDPVLYQ